MGILRWTPDTLRRASLEDMADAFFGFAGAHQIQAGAPPLSRAFLDDMMQRFPDKKEKT